MDGYKVPSNNNVHGHHLPVCCSQYTNSKMIHRHRGMKSCVIVVLVEKKLQYQFLILLCCVHKKNDFATPQTTSKLTTKSAFFRCFSQEFLQKSCKDSNGVRFTLKFSCLPSVHILGLSNAAPKHPAPHHRYQKRKYAKCANGYV